MTRIYSLAYLSSHRCTPAEAVQVAAQTGYSFVGLRLWPNAMGAPQQHLLGQPEALRETLTDFQPFHAAHATVLEKAGHHPAARTAYDRAIALATSDSDRLLLTERAAQLDSSRGS